MAKVFWAIVLFLILGGYLIKTGIDADLDKPEGQKPFIVEYGQWMFQLANNVKGISGFAIKQDWLPENYALFNDSDNNASNETEDDVEEEEDDS